MKLSDLPTPSLILDRSVLSRNADAMTRHVRSLGVNLRPHMKTAKSSHVARIALESNFGGITVSTLKEAEYFAGAGIRDIIYAVTCMPDKLPRIAALIRQGVTLAVIADRADVVAALDARARSLAVQVDVLIELDIGENRAGVRPDSPNLIEVGRAIHESSNLRLRGVLAHAGNAYSCRSIDAIREVAEQERAGAVAAAQRLRTTGLPCPVVSVGSTPTVLHARHLEGVTEARCGVYMFGDVFQAEINSCRLEDVALSVLATVIGHREDVNSALVDAGALALSKDRSTGAQGLAEDIGFGLVMDELGQERIDSVTVSRVYQEHGVLTSLGSFPYEQLPIGSRVRIFPNHSCLTAAMYDAYQVVEGDDVVVATWPRVNGW